MSRLYLPLGLLLIALGWLIGGPISWPLLGLVAGSGAAARLVQVRMLRRGHDVRAVRRVQSLVVFCILLPGLLMISPLTLLQRLLPYGVGTLMWAGHKNLL